MSDTQFGVLVALLVLVLVTKAADYLLVMRRFSRTDGQVGEVLAIAKTYYELGRTTHKDAKAVMEKVDTRAPQILEEVAKVPGKTAQEVVNKLESSDSQILKAPRPGE